MACRHPADHRRGTVNYSSYAEAPAFAGLGGQNPQAGIGAVAANDIASLVKFATMTSVNLFADRSAIQVLGCDGETIAGHIPVDRTLLAEIEAVIAELLDSSDA